MSLQALREFIDRHNAAAAGLNALGAALEARVSGAPLEPALAARIDELLAALGGDGLLRDVSAQEAAPLLAELRFTLGLEAKLLYARKRAAGWSHIEPEILQAGGDASAGFAMGLTRMVAPALDGLSERLAGPGAAFLDIGVGVAGLAIAMARLLPSLRVVGVDPWQPSIAIARANVEQAGLGDRIELRHQAAEQVEDEAAFDLAWVPIPFIAERSVPLVCRSAARALRPGGWLLMSMTRPGADPRNAALVRLRTTLWGGPLHSPEQGEALLRDAGLQSVRTLPSQPGSIIALIAGRRAG